MFGAECTGLGMVERGANAQPIKVLKADEVKSRGTEMSLKSGFLSIFKGDEAETPIATETKTSSVLAIAVHKSADQNAARQWIEKAGFRVDKAEQIDGVTLYVQADDADLEAATQVRLSDKVGVLCAFAPSVDSTDFEELIKQNGFVPGVEMAVGVLRQALFNSLFQSTAKSDFVKLASEAADGFAKHLKVLLGAVPADAFKLDPQFLGPMLASASATRKAAEPTVPATTTPVVKTEVVDLSGVEDGIAKLTGLVEGLGTRIGGVESRLGVVEKAATDATAVAKAAREAISGTVPATVEGDRKEPVQRSEGGSADLEMDTGYSRHRERHDRLRRSGGRRGDGMTSLRAS